MDWNLVGFIKASKYRRNILFELEKGRKTPLELSTTLNMYISHISKSLKELTEKKIIVCLTPKQRKGKIYSLTELGRQIAKEI
ncbi:hypothetical protein ES708_27126 [subsurface metagenome]